SLRAAPEKLDDTPSPALPAQPPQPAISTRPTRWKLVVALAAAGVAVAIGAGLWLQRSEDLWRSPIADARFQPLTGSEGVERADAVPLDGQFVAFLSDRDG